MMSKEVTDLIVLIADQASMAWLPPGHYARDEIPRARATLELLRHLAQTEYEVRAALLYVGENEQSASAKERLVKARTTLEGARALLAGRRLSDKILTEAVEAYCERKCAPCSLSVFTEVLQQATAAAENARARVKRKQVELESEQEALADYESLVKKRQQALDRQTGHVNK